MAEWHINADEIPLFDYNDDVWDTGEADEFEEESASLPLYEPNEFRTSDHDPILIGLDLSTPDTTAPHTTITANPDNPTASDDATFEYTSTCLLYTSRCV